MIKKLIFSLSLCTLCILQSFSQTDEDMIRYTIHNYFNGTSFSNLEQIRSAFFEEAKLYLESRDGELKVYTPEEYVAFFKNRKPGEFTGRYNHLININVIGNLAQVVAEISIPESKKIYTDIFLMRRMKPDQWLIISKSANNRDMEESGN